VATQRLLVEDEAIFERSTAHPVRAQALPDRAEEVRDPVGDAGHECGVRHLAACVAVFGQDWSEVCAGQAALDGFGAHRWRARRVAHDAARRALLW
jgi:hypothetical protein